MATTLVNYGSGGFSYYHVHYVELCTYYTSNNDFFALPSELAKDDR